MLKRVKIKELQPADYCLINGHRYKIYGHVIRDNQLMVAVYEDRLNQMKRKLSYLELDMEVLIAVK